MFWNFSVNPDELVAIPETGPGSSATSLVRACSGHTRLSTPVERIGIEGGAVRGVATEGVAFIEAESVNGAVRGGVDASWNRAFCLSRQAA